MRLAAIDDDMRSHADMVEEGHRGVIGHIDAAMAPVVEVTRTAEDAVPGAVMQADAAVEGHEAIDPDAVPRPGEIAVGILAFDGVYAVGCPEAIIYIAGNNGCGTDQAGILIAIGHLAGQIQLHIIAAEIDGTGILYRRIVFCGAVSADTAGEAVDQIGIQGICIDGLSARIHIQVDQRAVGGLELHGRPADRMGAHKPGAVGGNRLGVQRDAQSVRLDEQPARNLALSDPLITGFPSFGSKAVGKRYRKVGVRLLNGSGKLLAVGRLLPLGLLLLRAHFDLREQLAGGLRHLLDRFIIDYIGAGLPVRTDKGPAFRVIDKMRARRIVQQKRGLFRQFRRFRVFRRLCAFRRL